MTASSPSAKQPRIECLENGENGEAARISEALGAEIAASFGPPQTTPLSLHAYDGGDLVGGVNGFIHWRWLYIRHFWIAAPWRGKGLGRSLLTRAASEARARDCVGVYLDTFDPAAVRFYERCGFARCGEIANFPPGHTRVFMMRTL